jgi:FkbM family methyltransferase
MNITYGTLTNNIDVTSICKNKLLNMCYIIIPSGDFNRAAHFSDPLPGTLKSIFITINNKTTEYNHTKNIYINIKTNIVYVDIPDILKPKIINIFNEYRIPVDTNKFEKPEQNIANKHIKENDMVLELGARYGSVSCIINSKLKCKTNQVSVEPDNRVWKALERNKQINNCGFHIVKGFISSRKLGLIGGGYGTRSIEKSDTQIPSYTLDEIKTKYNLNFNVLVADCEGFLEVFFDENPTFYDELRMIIFEADFPNKCNYTKIRNTLKDKGFTQVLGGFQNIWKKLASTA